VSFEFPAFVTFNTNVKLKFTNLTSSVTAALQGSGETVNAPVTKVAVKGKYVASASSAGGNKAALRLVGIKVGTKIKITIKRSVRK
jgi:hypothetical protein